MLSWILNNLATIVLSLLLAAVVVWIIYGMVRDRKNGKSSCGGSCGGCPMQGSCKKK